MTPDHRKTSASSGPGPEPASEDCKAALEEAEGDMEKAAEILRKKGIAKAEKRAGRSASQGLVVIERRPPRQPAAMIELNCETDFVAKTDDFIALAHDLAKHVLAHAPVGVTPALDRRSAVPRQDGRARWSRRSPARPARR